MCAPSHAHTHLKLQSRRGERNAVRGRGEEREKIGVGASLFFFFISLSLSLHLTRVSKINHSKVFTNAQSQTGWHMATLVKCFPVCQRCQHLFHTHLHLKGGKRKKMDVSVTFKRVSKEEGREREGRFRRCVHVRRA